MKALLRLRRLAIAAGSSNGRTSRPILPSAAVAAAGISFGRSASTTSAVTPPMARSSAGPSPYAKSPQSAEVAFAGESSGSTTAGSAIATSMAAEAAAVHKLRYAHIIPRTDRGSELATQVWQSYISLSPATRRALPPRDLQSILRAVVPGKQYLGKFFTGRAETARVRGIRKRVAKRYEQRLRTVINDMRNRVPAAESSSAAAAAAAAETCPSRADYYFAMWCMSTARNMRSAEAIWTEAQSTISGRLGPMFTRLRLRAAYFSLEDSIDVGASLSGKRKLEPITTVLWDALAEFRNDPIARRRHTVSLLIKALGLAKTVFAPFKKHVKSYDDAMAYLMHAAYGIDMRYFTVPPQDGKSTLPVTADVLKALLDHLGDKGEVWRMVSAFEMLGERSVRDENFAEAFEEDEDDFGPTLSQMEAEEKERRRGISFFTAAKAADASPAPAGQSDIISESATEVASSEETDADRSSPLHTPFLPRAPTLREVLARGGNTPSSPAIQSIHTNTYVSLLDGVAAVGDKDLTTHYLRVALRHAEETSSVWLAQALQYASLLRDQQVAGGDIDGGSSTSPASRPALPAKVHAPLVTVSKAWSLPVLRLFRDRGTLVERQRVFALLEHALFMVDKEIRILTGGLEPDLVAIEADAAQAAAARDHVDAGVPVSDEMPAQGSLAAQMSAPIFDTEVAHVTGTASEIPTSAAHGDEISEETATVEPVVLASDSEDAVAMSAGADLASSAAEHADIEQAAEAEPAQPLLSDFIDARAHLESLRSTQRVLSGQLAHYRAISERRYVTKGASLERNRLRRAERQAAEAAADAQRKADLEAKRAQRERRKLEHEQEQLDQIRRDEAEGGRDGSDRQFNSFAAN